MVALKAVFRSIEKLRVERGDVLVFEAGDNPEAAQQVIRQLSYVHSERQEHVPPLPIGTLLLLLLPGMTVQALDAATMRQYGWVRDPSYVPPVNG